MNALDERSRWRLLRHVAACCGMRHVVACGMLRPWMCVNAMEVRMPQPWWGFAPSCRRHCHSIAIVLHFDVQRSSHTFSNPFRTRSEPVPSLFRSVPSRCEHDPHQGRGWNRRCGGGCQAHSHLAQGAIPSTLEHSTFHTSACAFAACLQHACSMLATCLQHPCLWLWLCLAPYDFLSFWAFHSGDPNGADDGRWWALHLCKGQRNWVKWLTASPIFCNMLPTPWSLADNASGKEIGAPIDLLQQAVVFSSIFEVSAGWRQHNILLRWPVL